MDTNLIKELLGRYLEHVKGRMETKAIILADMVEDDLEGDAKEYAKAFHVYLKEAQLISLALKGLEETK